MTVPLFAELRRKLPAKTYGKLIDLAEEAWDSCDAHEAEVATFMSKGDQPRESSVQVEQRLP